MRLIGRWISHVLIERRNALSRITIAIACAAMLLSGSRSVNAADARKPNVLIILTDDQGWGDVTCYGAKDLRTPNMDKLISAGMRFDNFYANCCVCSPTRAALLSGRYQELVGVPGVIRTRPEDNWGYLTSDAVLLPTPLKKVGYHSAIVGKWHLGLEAPNTPMDRGFDHFHGMLCDMLDDYWTHRRHGINYMRLDRQEIDPTGHATDLFTQWAVDYINDRKGKDEPWMLYLAYNAPHFPVQPPPEWLEKVKQREQGIDPMRAKLVALIEHLDDGIGKVIAALKESGQYDNTMIFFTSDNGGHEGSKANVGPYRGFKEHMYEGGLRVPACVVWPGHIAPGSRTDQIAVSFDIFATVCEVTGAPLKKGAIDGVSILPTLLGQKQTISRDLFFCRREGGGRYQGQEYYAMRRGDWKLLHDSPFQPLELYNLKDDPRETMNLAAKERKVFNDMAAALRLHIQRAGAVPWQKP